MKKLLLVTGVILMLFGCQKQKEADQPIDKWNGYESFLKTGEVTYDLLAGQTIDVGSVTYGMNADGYFYVTYETDGDWILLETHMFEGDKIDLPVSKPGNPKIGQFPYSANYAEGDAVTTDTYTTLLIDLPPCGEPGFIVATHAVVKNTVTGQTETAWGDWHGANGYEFCDRRWGGYNTYYYNVPPNIVSYVYGSQYDSDDGTLNIYLINASDGTGENVLSENVGIDPSGSYDGLAWDPVTNYLLFTSNSDDQPSELYINTMADEKAREINAGSLSGVVKSADFYDGQFYYIDANTNDIVSVTFNGGWKINSETILSTIDASDINDIAINPDGTEMIIVSGTGELYSLDMTNYELSELTPIIGVSTIGVQITYGSDGELYMVSSVDETGSVISSLDPTTGISTQIGATDIIPGGIIISDLGMGPIQ